MVPVSSWGGGFELSQIQGLCDFPGAVWGNCMDLGQGNSRRGGERRSWAHPQGSVRPSPQFWFLRAFLGSKPMQEWFGRTLNPIQLHPGTSPTIPESSSLTLNIPGMANPQIPWEFHPKSGRILIYPEKKPGSFCSWSSRTLTEPPSRRINGI